ncbi:MAG: hypothetical protein AB7P08_17275 [Burkholderiales bacterium]
MIDYSIKLDIDAAAARFQRLPADIEVALNWGFERIALEGVRRARNEAPKFQSVLLNAIHSRSPDANTVEIVAGTRYAEYVERGTGPAAGKASYLPPASHLYGYVKARANLSFRNSARGSAARGAQYDEIRDRAWALARYIQRHGTKPDPFMDRTRAYLEKRAPEIMAREIGRVAFGSGT